MTVTDVAFGTAWPGRRGPAPRRWMVGAFAIALSGWGLVALAVEFSGPDTYAAIARENGSAPTSFLLPAGDPRATAQPMDLASLVQWHERWAAYVLGRSPNAPGPAAFTPEEIRHMADVRSVFVSAQALMYISAAAALVLFGLALRTGPRTAGLLLRDGGLAAAAAVLAVGIAAAVAFEPAFLAFHRIFFPQGNFLFDPATSNLLRLYPEAYWYAVTLRIGATFIVIAVASAVVGWWLSRSAIVTRR